MVEPMLTTAIGIPVFNSANNVKNLIYAIKATSDLKGVKGIFVLDDCSPNHLISKEISEFCHKNGTNYTCAKSNGGVPASWNALIASTDADVAIILNDDVRPMNFGWLDNVSSIFSLNDTIGIVYWAQRRVDPISGEFLKYTGDSIWFAQDGRHPLLRSNFCGAFFAVRRSLWKSVTQPDGSVGFWADLKAYGEEIDFSSECHALGMHIVQLPIFWEHLQGQTFKTDSKLGVRKKLSSYLSDEEFCDFCGRYPQFAAYPQLGRKQKVLNLVRSSKLTAQHLGYPKLEYSLAMVFKKWRNRSIMGMDGIEYLTRLLTDGFPGVLKVAGAEGYNLPSSIRYTNEQGVESVASLEQALSDSTQNLL